jgi:hypothetical protein
MEKDVAMRKLQALLRRNLDSALRDEVATQLASIFGKVHKVVAPVPEEEEVHYG